MQGFREINEEDLARAHFVYSLFFENLWSDPNFLFDYFKNREETAYGFRKTISRVNPKLRLIEIDIRRLSTNYTIWYREGEVGERAFSLRFPFWTYNWSESTFDFDSLRGKNVLQVLFQRGDLFEPIDLIRCRLVCKSWAHCATSDMVWAKQIEKYGPYERAWFANEKVSKFRAFILGSFTKFVPSSLVAPYQFIPFSGIQSICMKNPERWESLKRLRPGAIPLLAPRKKRKTRVNCNNVIRTNSHGEVVGCSLNNLVILCEKRNPQLACKYPCSSYRYRVDNNGQLFYNSLYVPERKLTRSDGIIIHYERVKRVERGLSLMKKYIKR